MKIELEIPDLTGGPSRKFMISRALKAKWDEDSLKVTNQILEEIKNYKGSFVGDIVKSLNSIFYSRRNLIKEETTRENDVARWAAQLIDSIIFSGTVDESCVDFMEDNSLTEWDGSIKELEVISQNELREVDIEKVMLLLTPKIKHALFLLSKKIKSSIES